MKRKIASHYALINGRLERGIVVEVDASGTITDIIYATALDSMAGVEFYPGILTAGFINAHCHLELSYLRGAIAEGLGYGGFASAIGSVRGGYSDQERIHAAEVADAEPIPPMATPTLAVSRAGASLTPSPVIETT
mgnify:CR=1 FL=1